MKIKNWKLAILALIFFCGFTALGIWQLARAQQKRILIQSFQLRTAQPPLSALALLQKKDVRFYRTQLQGEFDNAHTFLLDNKIHNGRVGYEVYTPFKAENINKLILIDRGFMPINNRTAIPRIEQIPHRVTITGMVNTPPTYVAFGKMEDALHTDWPKRIEYIHLQKLSALLQQSFLPFIVVLQANDKAAYAIDNQIVNMPPQRHLGYAVQWFALALTLLILFVALNFRVS